MASTVVHVVLLLQGVRRPPPPSDPPSADRGAVVADANLIVMPAAVHARRFIARKFRFLLCLPAAAAVRDAGARRGARGAHRPPASPRAVQTMDRTRPAGRRLGVRAPSIGRSKVRLVAFELVRADIPAEAATAAAAAAATGRRLPSRPGRRDPPATPLVRDGHCAAAAAATATPTAPRAAAATPATPRAAAVGGATPAVAVAVATATVAAVGAPSGATASGGRGGRERQRRPRVGPAPTPRR